jgi:integrase
MARKARTNVYGPYKRGGRWRIVLKSGSRQSAHSFATEAAAHAFAAEARAQIEGRTVMQALDEYLAHLKTKGRAASTIAYLHNAITRMVPDAPLESIGPGRARTLYDAVVAQEYAAATHQHGLAVTTTAWEWFIRQGWITANPWERVEPLGQVARRKPQLSLDEARVFVEVAYREAERAAGPVTALLAFLLGMRAGEIVGLRGRDIDDGGRLVRIERGKTRKAERTLEVPERLRPLVLRHAAAAGALGRLFPFDRPNVGYWTRKLCKLAGVRVVCPHGLRGTHSTLAIGAGATAHLVAAALGHAGPTVTRAHYIAPGAEDQTAADQLHALLGGNGNDSIRYRPRTDDAN